MPNRHPYSDTPLLLLSAVGRSGTLALRTTLGAHPNIISTGAENNIVYDIAELASRNASTPSRVAAMQVPPDRYAAIFARLILDLHWPNPLAEMPAPAWLMLMSDLTPRGGDFLLSAFPRVKILYLVRNGIEVISSRMLHHGFAHLSFEQQCEQWNRTLEMARWGEQLNLAAPEPRFHLVRHENLIQPDEAGAELARIWTFLGVPPSAACERHLLSNDFHPTAAPGEDPGARSDRSRRIERWSLWTNQQRRQFFEHCAPAMAHFGYEIPTGAQTCAPLHV